MRNNYEYFLQNLIAVLPTVYNSEVTDTNYYKLLKAFSYNLEQIDSQIEQLHDNLFLETADEDALYKNFGVLVDLDKNPNNTYEKYRRLLKGVIKSFIDGPTKDNVAEGARHFTHMKIDIYELYKDNFDLQTKEQLNINRKYAFLVDITKPEELEEDISTFFSDLRHFITKVRPAHTIMLFSFNFRMSEYWWANKDKNIDKLEYQLGFKEFKYGYIVHPDKFIHTNKDTLQGPKVLGPAIYILKDEFATKIKQFCYENYQEVIEKLTIKIPLKFEEDATTFLNDIIEDYEIRLAKIFEEDYDISKTEDYFKLKCSSENYEKYIAPAIQHAFGVLMPDEKFDSDKINDYFLIGRQYNQEENFEKPIEDNSVDVLFDSNEEEFAAYQYGFILNIPRTRLNNASITLGRPQRFVKIKEDFEVIWS